MNVSISAVGACALLVCSVIVVLFGGAILGFDVSYVAATLFVLAMIALISGLLVFLHDLLRD